MSKDEVNLRKLEKELVSALEADKKYSRENDAKFRAIHQKVATYEEFRDIVKASHLNPLERKDLLSDGSHKQPWNTATGVGVRGGGCEDDEGGVCLGREGRPGNVQEFTRDWRRLKQASDEEQYKFLIDIGGKHLRELFKVEISMGLLGEMLVILNKCWRDVDAREISSILEQLSASARFSLSVGFLNKAEHSAATELLRKLNSNSAIADDIRKLAELYCVPPIS